MKKKTIASMIAMMTGSLAAAPAMAEPEVSVHGAVEVELASMEAYDGSKATDITLATVEIAVDAKVNDKVNAHTLFLYEDGESDGPLMDEGTINYAFGSSSVTMGKMYIPFGVFDTAIVSDPMTLELGETNEVVLMYSNRTGMFAFDLYAFNGEISTIDTAVAGDDTDMVFGVNVGVAKEGVFGVNLGYLSNIADSDSITGFAGGANFVDSFVAGYALSANASFGPVTVMLEHVAAADKFTNLDFGGLTAATDMQPAASLIDVAVDLGEVGLGLSYQTTSDALFLELPEKAFGLAAHIGIADDTELGVEYASMTDYDIVDGGTGESASHIMVQLATEF